MLMTEIVTIDIIEQENDEDTLTKVRWAELAGAWDQKLLRGLWIVKFDLQLDESGPSGPGVKCKQVFCNVQCDAVLQLS